MSYPPARLADGYDAIRVRSGIGSVDARRQIAVAGRDRATYLQGLLTNDIVALAPGTGCYAAWLTPQGRMLTDMHVLESGDLILLDLPAGQAERTLAQLDQYLFGEDVQLAALDGQLMGTWIHGPAASEVLDAVCTGVGGLDSWPVYRVAKAGFGDVPVVAARIDQLGVPGFCVYLPPASESAFGDALRNAGAVDVSPAAIEALRIEAGYPVYGVDMTDDTIPLEAGIDARAISFSKGCYVGQEVIIRVLHRGHGRVARRLVGLRIDGPVAGAGSKVRVAEKEVGFITSCAASPGGTIALGYVHRDFVEPGTVVHVQLDDSLAPATVTGPNRV